jgi:hypothetical protein
MSKTVKIILSITLIIWGFLSIGIGFGIKIAQLNTFLFLSGFFFIPLGIILLVFALISKVKK